MCWKVDCVAAAGLSYFNVIRETRRFPSWYECVPDTLQLGAQVFILVRVEVTPDRQTRHFTPEHHSPPCSRKIKTISL